MKLQKQKGFTLIELTMVVVIIMILAAAVAPNLDKLSPKYSLRAGAREISSTIESARSQSALTSKTYSIVYDIDEQEYWILLPEEVNSFGELTEEERKIVLPKRRLPRGVKLVEVIMADNETNTSGQVQFDFSPFGNTGSHITVVQYGDEEEMRIWIKTNALLGFTTFHSEELSFQEYDEEEDDEFYGQETQTP